MSCWRLTSREDNSACPATHTTLSTYRIDSDRATSTGRGLLSSAGAAQSGQSEFGGAERRLRTVRRLEGDALLLGETYANMRQARVVGNLGRHLLVPKPVLVVLCLGKAWTSLYGAGSVQAWGERRGI
jgi:hypothetical protein